MKTYVVQLEDHDDITSARDKLSWSKANRVLIVWPRKGDVLTRRVDLLLLQRYSYHLGMQLAIVTQSGEVKMNAHALGIPVFSSVERAQKTAWRRTKSWRPFFRNHERKPVEAQTLRQQRNALFTKPADYPWLHLGMFGLGILSFLVLVLFFSPGAEVQLTPERKQQQVVMDVWASPSMLSPGPSGGLPAQVISLVVEGHDQVNSTGQVRAPDLYATGAVQLKNLTGATVTVPEGSIVITLDQPPVRYAVTQTVEVPAGPGKTAQAAVRAVNPGSQGNQPAGMIQAMEGPLGVRLATENVEAITGGSIRTITAPSEQDYQNLRMKLLSHLQEAALSEMRGKMQPGQRLLESTLYVQRIVEETRDPPQGLPGDQLQLSLQVAYGALLVNEVDLQVTAQLALNAGLAPGFEPLPGPVNVVFMDDPNLDQISSAAQNQANTANESENSPDITARWKLQASRTLEATWSNANLINMLRGRSINDAQHFLQTELPLAEPPRITLFPAFWSRMPYLSARITLVKQ